MKQVWLSIVAALALLFAATPAWSQEDKVTPRDREIAKRAYLHAIELYKAERYAEAAAELRKVYTYVPLPAILFNLGITYIKLGNRPAAKAALTEYLKAMPNAPNRGDAERLLAELDRAAPAEGAPSEKGKAEAEPEEKTQEGAAPEHAERDEENPLTKPAPKREGEWPPPESPERFRLWKWVTAGVGVGAVVTGVLLLKRASDQESALLSAASRGGTYPTYAYDQTVRSVEEGYTTNRLWGTVAVIGGGALVATAVTFFILDHRSSRDAQRASVTPVVGPGMAGLSARGAF